MEEKKFKIERYGLTITMSMKTTIVLINHKTLKELELFFLELEKCANNQNSKIEFKKIIDLIRKASSCDARFEEISALDKKLNLVISFSILENLLKFQNQFLNF